jgi:MFS family permease
MVASEKLPAAEEEDQPPAPNTIRRGGTFTALSYPNYRLWYFGQMFSLMGTWMQSTAQAYLAYQLTQSPAYLGYIGFANGLPSWIFMLYAGVIADRLPRRNVLVAAQSLMMILAIILAVLTFTGKVQAWHLIVLALFLGIANAFDAPARQSFVLEMVPREHMTNAIALNSSMFNAAAAVGPAVGGLVYAAIGPAWCFTFNAVSFLAVLAALALMKLKPIKAQPGKGKALADIRAGLSYVVGERLIRTVIINLTVVSLFGMSFVTLLPAWAVDVLGGDAATNGYLQSARGAGAMIGALLLATFSGVFAKGRLLTLGSFMMPVFVVVFSLARWTPLSLALIFFTGLGFMVFANSSNALTQSLVPDELRGRVMSIFTLAFFGFMPLGSLLAGQAAARLGEPVTVLVGGALLLLYSIWVWLRVPELRQTP